MLKSILNSSQKHKELPGDREVYEDLSRNISHSMLKITKKLKLPKCPPSLQKWLTKLWLLDTMKRQKPLEIMQ